ncbi:ABC transporter ATP-binding protein [Paenibacillus sp. FJAT-26967]|uniref:ABC transporter ATP-binding protein n=1 Tax=Paenibacillus sp. FJAT-26967 TaxID=1729690 RepID=UPI00083915A2|nr:ABC transporter ATP-binding protein [Paenibacillus sp. FJAT-26967]
MIRFENVSKHYAGNVTAVDSLDLTIREGEFFVLIGPSGCGKTTTLKMINRLIPLSEGTLWINGKKISEYDIHELRWNIGYVLQQIALFPHMTIEENISIVPELRKWERSRISKRVDELLEMVGLDPAEYRSRKPAELSGGQQQRIGVIRALASDPGIILMDEPFSALDPLSREKLQNDLLELQNRIKKTIVFVTHDIQEALKLGDRICLMNEGRIEQLDTPQGFLEHPASDFVRQFVGGASRQSMFSGNLTLEEILRAAGRTEVHADHAGAGAIAGTPAPAAVVSADTTLEDALELFAADDSIIVEKNGAILGSITRQSLLQFMSERVKAGAVQ